MKDSYYHELVPRFIPSSIVKLECYELVSGVLRVIISVTIAMGGLIFVLSDKVTG